MGGKAGGRVKVGRGMEGREREMDRERYRLRHCGSVIPTRRQPSLS